MNKLEAHDVIMECLTDALKKYEGVPISSSMKSKLIEDIALELKVLQDIGITIDFRTEENIYTLAELSTLWLLPIEEDQDPKDLLRKLPDSIIEQLVSNVPEENELNHPFNMINAEYMFRNGKLDKDWTWKRINESEAIVKFSKKNPDLIKVTFIGEENDISNDEELSLDEDDLIAEPEEPS